MKYEPAVIIGKPDVPEEEKTSLYKFVTDSYDKIKVDGTEWQTIRIQVNEV